MMFNYKDYAKLMQDNYESLVYEYIDFFQEQIEEVYGVEDITELSKDQIESVREFADQIEQNMPNTLFFAECLRDIVTIWEVENDDKAD